MRVSGRGVLTLRTPRLLLRTRIESFDRTTRFSYGEDRYELIGRIEGRLYLLIYTPRHDGIRIISARKANSREVKRYENRSHED